MRGKNVIGGMVGTFIPIPRLFYKGGCSMDFGYLHQTPKGEGSIATGKIVFCKVKLQYAISSSNLPSQSRSLLASSQN